MKSSFSTVLLLGARLVRAFEPYSPDTVTEGTTMQIKWDTNDSDDWKATTIQLMTGDNWNMVPLMTIAEDVDCQATDSLDFDVPFVDPNAAIYFFQFSMNGVVSEDTTRWTSRFAIAAEDGTVTVAPETTQPNGDEIPWGTGVLEYASSVSSSLSASQHGAFSQVPFSSTSGGLSGPSSGFGLPSGIGSDSAVVPAPTGHSSGFGQGSGHGKCGARHTVSRSTKSSALATETTSESSFETEAGTTSIEETSTVPTGGAAANFAYASYLSMLGCAALVVLA